MERRRREWDEHVTRMNANRLVNISRDNIPAGRRSSRYLKRRWSELILVKTGRIICNKKKKKKKFKIKVVVLFYSP